MEIPEDFRELLKYLNSRNVEYLIVGGYALAFHGVPRFTGDLDLFVAISQQNADEILNALDDFGMGTLGLKQEDFMAPDNVIQIGYPPLRVDIMTGISGISWINAWQNRVSAMIGGIHVSFLSRDDLIKNKEAVGRPVDLGDLDRLLKF